MTESFRVAGDSEGKRLSGLKPILLNGSNRYRNPIRTIGILRIANRLIRNTGRGEYRSPRPAFLSGSHVSSPLFHQIPASLEYVRGMAIRGFRLIRYGMRQ